MIWTPYLLTVAPYAICGFFLIAALIFVVMASLPREGL